MSCGRKRPSSPSACSVTRRKVAHGRTPQDRAVSLPRFPAAPLVQGGAGSGGRDALELHRSPRAASAHFYRQHPAIWLPQWRKRGLPANWSDSVRSCVRAASPGARLTPFGRGSYTRCGGVGISLRQILQRTALAPSYFRKNLPSSWQVLARTCAIILAPVSGQVLAKFLFSPFLGDQPWLTRSADRLHPCC